MKALLITFLLMFQNWAFAGEEKIILEIQPSDVVSICQGNVLRVRIDSLKRYTESRLDEVSYKALTPAICSAIKSQFHLSRSIQVELRRTKTYTYDILKLSPCHVGGPDCSGTYRFYDIEGIDLMVLGVPLQGNKEISGTTKIKTYEWESGECPPVGAPSCGL